MAWEFESPPGHQYERTSFDSNAEALFLPCLQKKKKSRGVWPRDFCYSEDRYRTRKSGSGLDEEDFGFRSVLAHAFDAFATGRITGIDF